MNSIEEPTKINMAMLYYFDLNRLRTYKATAAVFGDVTAYRDCLEQIYINISFKLKKDEKNEIEKKMKEIDTLMFETQHSPNNIAKMKSKLREVDIKLHKIMDERKMIFPAIEAVGLDALQKRYGLNDAQD